MQTQSRSGYHVIVWTEGFDPSLTPMLTAFPELIVGYRIVIASCDSGPFQPDQLDLVQGWTLHDTMAISPQVKNVSDLPTPGFDEWYVYDGQARFEYHASFVNRYGFSPLDESCEYANDFWRQVGQYQPLHVLGTGAPAMFVVTKDEDVFKRIQSI
ncbi:hypothetical protein ACO0LM_24520 [Undibacterium sp. Di26W]|uniref:hypothetical protein n=1 Tax=Undibacterium sp. Di26W TaxID=3413035 RepID=UPI003BF3BDCC